MTEINSEPSSRTQSGAATSLWPVGSSQIAIRARLTSTFTDSHLTEAAVYSDNGAMPGVLMQFWPSCPEHNAATYAALAAEIPVWFGRIGDHALREIGEG